MFQKQLKLLQTFVVHNDITKTC